MRMRRSTRLAKELADDRHAVLGKCHLSHHVLRKLCIEVDEKTTSADQDATPAEERRPRWLAPKPLP